MDKEFAEAFKEEIELTEMKWEVGGVYHQEFKNGDKVYFKAGSVQKNKRWKGLSVDEFGGRQKKAKSASADEKQQGWETTPKNEIPKGLKEEVEIDEARKAAKDIGLECQECGKRFRSKNPRYGVTKCPKCKSTDLDLAYGEEVEVDEARSKEDELELAKTIAAWKKAGGKVKKLPPGKKFKSLFKGKPLPRQEEVEIDEGKFKKGDIVIPNMGPHKGEKHKIIHDFGDGSYNITPQKHSRFIKYKQGAAKAKENQLKLVKEEVEKRWTGGKLPPHLAKFFDKDGNLKKDAAARVAKGREKINWIDVTPKGYGPKEEVEEASTYRDRAKDDEKKKKKHFAFGGKKKSRHGESGYGKGEEVKVEATRMPMEAPFKLEEEIFYWYIIRGDLANGKIVFAGNEKQAKLKRHDPKFGDGHVMTKSRKMKKVGDKWKKSEGVSEEIEIDELVAPGKKSSSGYILYHKDFSSAMQHAVAHAKKKGHIVDPKEIDDKVATGPKKPSRGKTNRYSLKAGRKTVQIQVANLDNKAYELNMYIESENTASKHPLEVRRKKYVELNKKDTLNPLNKVKEALTRIRSLVKKPEEVELEEIPSPNQAAIDAFLKKGGKINDPKYAPDLKKRKKDIASFQKSFANTKQKEKDADKKAKRHYVSGGGKQGDSTQQSSDYVTQKDIKKFPSSLTSGLKKIISGAKMQKYEIKTRKYGKIPGLGIIFPGSTTPKLMIQFDEYTSDRDRKSTHPKVGADPEYSEKGTDPKIHRKFQMSVWINEAPTAKGKISDKIDWYQRKEFDGKTADGVAKRTLQYLKTKVKRMVKEEIAPAHEGIDIEKASMGAVIKDFQDSDAPQFKGKSDKKRKEMAIAAKLSKEEKEETDDPKSKKKDKINLKPKMDETMKNYKEFMKKVKEDTDPDTKGTQGDNAEWKKARSGVLKKYGVASCAFIKDDKTKKQCFKDLDDAHVADHEEQVKKEEVEVSENIKDYKDVVSKILGRRKEAQKVQEGVTTGGIEYGEQHWDVQHRLENSYPNLHANYSEFHEQGLEGPYLWHGETYFFDRKVGSWYSVTAEDFVDDEISKDLSLAYVKDGMYKRQFAS